MYCSQCVSCVGGPSSLRLSPGLRGPSSLLPLTLLLLLLLTFSALARGGPVIKDSPQSVDPLDDEPLVVDPDLELHLERNPALLDISYVDHRNHSVITRRMTGLFGKNSRIATVKAVVVHVKSRDGRRNGCGDLLDWNIPVGRPWVALVARGKCTFTQKVENLVKNYNATAVAVYNTDKKEDLFIIDHPVMNVVSVLISKQDGQLIGDLFDNGITVSMSITNQRLIEAAIAEEAANILRLENERLTRSRSVLAMSLLVILGVCAGLTYLLVNALRSLAASKSKAARRDVIKSKDWKNATG